MIERELRKTGIEHRQRRRFSVSSRVFLALVLAAAETAIASGLALAGITVSPILPETARHGAQFILLLVFALSYGWFTTNAALRFLRAPTAFYPVPLEAALTYIACFGALVLVGFALGGTVAPLELTAWIVGSAAVQALVRSSIFRAIQTMLENGQFQIERVGLIGRAADIERLGRQAPVWKQGAQVVTTLALDQNLAESAPESAALHAFIEDCVERGCSQILLVGHAGDLEAIGVIITPAREFALDVVYLASPVENGASRQIADVAALGPSGTLILQARPLGFIGLLTKRALDMFGAGFGLLLLSPLLLIVALLIRLDSPGPVLFRQRRRGFNGQEFSIYKFRSMTVTEDGGDVRQAQKNDARVTRLGAFLRRSSIDELPQLLNVLRGEMSLVGPRPHALVHDEELTQKAADYAFRRRIKPGITGWAQVNGYRGDTSTPHAIEGRVLCDLYYIDNWSLALDLWIILLTVLSRRASKNAY
ncbi:UDP-glucose:undecaprenyl-phosphate glucose-1-phosphate transferase [Devosia equisanguinis]|uniref:UDP-glucose:undecaprenyl-phosphate glucose-1-phosphate transferase n=1 Tax=Devosia equisanguinis TaxID=2490941 RepID=A0A447IEL6_9HYPH|nr:exopolysaccharide biosynthesis polyprenyl glycosylphosphotransferase [Devosia equisanguinis]VDS05937.1 UDP-glucose:undecaprenyl-phosphate glucose-1-phosphate transferase [Devosia equisanguinis]